MKEYSDTVHGNRDGAHQEHDQRDLFSGHTTLPLAFTASSFTRLHFSLSLFLWSARSWVRCLALERAGWSQSLCSQTLCAYGYGLLAGTAAWQVGPFPETILRHRKQEQDTYILFLCYCSKPFTKPYFTRIKKNSLALISVLPMYLNVRVAHDIFLTAKAL